MKDENMFRLDKITCLPECFSGVTMFMRMFGNTLNYQLNYSNDNQELRPDIIVTIYATSIYTTTNRELHTMNITIQLIFGMTIKPFKGVFQMIRYEYG